MMEIPDNALIQGLKSGSTDSFDRIFRKYHTLLLYTARGYFHNNFLAEEVIADVFLHIWQKRDTITVNTSLKDYLTRAVINKCTDYYRIQHNQNRLKMEIGRQQQFSFALIDLGEDPLEYTITHELEELIKDAVESLPERSKQAFKLSRYADMTYDQIAVEMGISKDGVKINIKNALAHLRDKLAEFLTLTAMVLSYLLKQVP